MMKPRGEAYGPFEVLERLGVGGMATVHRAVERGANGFERTVALKRLLPHLAEDADFVRAFVREAKLASLLRHDNVVKLYELGRVGASYFISMEYIAGRDLRVILRRARRMRGPPPVAISIGLVTQLLDALDYAHGHSDDEGNPLGIIHRDISPSNVLVGHTGHLKVIDFGIAKATFGHLMTHSGRIKGKLAYMAPEALAGRVLDGRSDLFSASVIAHELLTATPLFAAKDDFQIIDRLQNMQPPPPSALNPSCSAELDEIVLRGLAKEPDERWYSAADMRSAIAALAVERGLLATNEDVATWVDDAFQKQAPVTSARSAAPLVPPPSAPTEGRPGSSARTELDELMDIVWSESHIGPMPVVLDEIPDVAAKPPAGDAEPVVHRSDASLILRRSSPSAGSHGTSATVGLGASRGHEGSESPPSWTGPDRRQVTNPSGWALGTGPRSQQRQREETLDEVVRAARRTEAVVMAAMAVRRRTIAPLLVASVAVSAAGAGSAWLIVGGRRAPSASSASAGEGVRLPPRAQSATDASGVALAEAHGTPPLSSTPARGVAAAQSAPLSGSPPGGAGAAAQSPPLAGGPGGTVSAALAPRSGAPPGGAVAAPPASRVGAPPGSPVASAPAPWSGAQRGGTLSGPPSPTVSALPRGARESAPQPAVVVTQDSSGSREGEPGVHLGIDREARRKQDASDDRTSRRVRPRRGRVDRERPRDGDPLAVNDEHLAVKPEKPDGGTASTAETPAPGAPTPAELVPAAGKIETTRRQDLAPLPVPVKPPVTERIDPPSRPAHPGTPLIVSASRAQRESGNVQPIHFPSGEQLPPRITAKLCIDTRGVVTSVMVLSTVSPRVRYAVEQALLKWRYRPVVEAGDKVAACFATAFPVRLD